MTRLLNLLPSTRTITFWLMAISIYSPGPLGLWAAGSELAQVSTSESARVAYGQLPLSFEANHGQTNSAVNFLSRGPGYTLFLTPSEAVFVLLEAQITPGPPAVLRMKLEGANPQSVPTGEKILEGKVNYLVGSDPRNWRTNIPTFARVKYAGVYKGIDLVYHGDRRQLEYDFVVQPGADHSQIVLRFDDAVRVELDSVTGDLLLGLGEKVLRQPKPTVYQEVKGRRQEIASGYELKGRNRVGFFVAPYDASEPLVIDPVLAYSTYLGGSAAESANAIAVDSAGQAYIGAGVNSANFPVTSGAFDTSFTGIQDSVVAKLNAAGSALLYCTYLGGGGTEIATGLAVDGAGNAYATGRTNSTDFPTTPGAFDSSYGGGATDSYVAKLNASGSALLYSSYLGGGSTDNGRAIALDSSGRAYVTGFTNSPDFPTVNALDSTFGGGTCGAAACNDVFIAIVNAAGSALALSTYLGGTGDEQAQGIGLDSSGNIYVTGFTASTNFPTANAFSATFNGGANDVFVTKVNAAGTALAYSSYLGGGGDDRGFAIAVHPSGRIFVTGSTASTNFPTANAITATAPGGGDAFVTQVNAAGSALIYSTYLGGSGSDIGNGIAVDSAGNAHVTGSTASLNFPTANALQATNRGGTNDAFFAKLNAAGSAFIYSTYLGGTLFDAGLSVAIDPVGNAYFGGHTSSGDFPTAGPPAQGTKAGTTDTDAFVVKVGNYVITGRVTNSSGAPLSGVTVTLSGSNSAVTTTDEAGRFSFLDTTLGGSYTVTPSKTRYVFSPSSISITNFNANQELNFVGFKPQLANIATRMRVETGDNALIGGFILTGTEDKRVLIRGLGPSIGVGGALGDTVLQLFDSSGTLLRQNDNWEGAPNRQEIIDSTIPPPSSFESAILMSLPANGRGYTAVLRGFQNETGIGLVEVYDLNLNVDSRLANISTRGLVQIGDDVMIAGFIVLDGDQRVIVRGIGPSLTVPGKLANPILELRNNNGGLIASNDNWRSDQEAEIVGTTIPPSDDLESAIVRTLPPANYTAILRGVDNTTGVGVVEVYALN